MSRLVIPIVVFLVLVGGIGAAAATGAAWHSSLGGWLSDGDGKDTFYDRPMIDMPGLSLFQVHCHGFMRYDFQVGATGPNHNNPCYAALGVYDGPGGQTDMMVMLPGGAKALYRTSANNGPWTYYIGDVIYAPGPGSGSG